MKPISIFLLSCCVLTPFKGNSQSIEKSDNCKQLIITFETFYKNQKCRIYIDDTLFFQQRIVNHNPLVLTLAESIVIPSVPNRIKVNVGTHKKNIILKKGECYIYVKRIRFLGFIKIEVSNSQRKYR